LQKNSWHKKNSQEIRILVNFSGGRIYDRCRAEAKSSFKYVLNTHHFLFILITRVDWQVLCSTDFSKAFVTTKEESELENLWSEWQQNLKPTNENSFQEFLRLVDKSASLNSKTQTVCIYSITISNYFRREELRTTVGDAKWMDGRLQQGAKTVEGNWAALPQISRLRAKEAAEDLPRCSWPHSGPLAR